MIISKSKSPNRELYRLVFALQAFWVQFSCMSMPQGWSISKAGVCHTHPSSPPVLLVHPAPAGSQQCYCHRIRELLAKEPAGPCYWHCQTRVLPAGAAGSFLRLRGWHRAIILTTVHGNSCFPSGIQAIFPSGLSVGSRTAINKAG